MILAASEYIKRVTLAALDYKRDFSGFKIH